LNRKKQSDKKKGRKRPKKVIEQKGTELLYIRDDIS
jgi:hypothetical protein